MGVGFFHTVRGSVDPRNRRFVPGWSELWRCAGISDPVRRYPRAPWVWWNFDGSIQDRIF